MLAVTASAPHPGSRAPEPRPPFGLGSGVHAALGLASGDDGAGSPR